MDIPNHNIIYLIEGNLNFFNPPRNMSKETLYSCFVSLMYFQGFSVSVQMILKKVQNL